MIGRSASLRLIGDMHERVHHFHIFAKEMLRLEDISRATSLLEEEKEAHTPNEEYGPRRAKLPPGDTQTMQR